MKWSIAIHGGAGALKKGSYTAKQEERYHQALKKSLETGQVILSSGGSSLDAVVAATKVMEDHPLFNAGKGGVFAGNGKVELDASVMDGHSKKAGSVCTVKRIRNPILAAKTILEETHHIMLSGLGAEQFAKKHKLKMVDNSFFHTSLRFKQWKKARSLKLSTLDHTVDISMKSGTVGAVALDSQGGLAAATSTGGMTNKLAGRVSDSSMIGAGNYANSVCAVSGTGEGDYFIRTVAAKAIADRVELAGESIKQATLKVLDEIKSLGGSGGFIVIDHKGKVFLPFNTAGMLRGFVSESSKITTEIY